LQIISAVRKSASAEELTDKIHQGGKGWGFYFIHREMTARTIEVSQKMHKAED